LKIHIYSPFNIFAILSILQEDVKLLLSGISPIVLVQRLVIFTDEIKVKIEDFVLVTKEDYLDAQQGVDNCAENSEILPIN
jgi:hypothetical protein